MKNRTSLIAATLASLFASSAFASSGDATSMTVDTNAPLRATLMNANREDLLSEKFGPEIKPVLEALAPNASSRLERLGIEAMMGKL